jgi:hypothetical protein
VSRTDRDQPGKRDAAYWRRYYRTESAYARFLTRRRNRRKGKKLLEDAPPEKGTQGWMTH